LRRCDETQSAVETARDTILLGEGKPREAIAEFKQSGTDPYADLGMIEAYRMLKDHRQAEAARTAFFANRNYSYASTATPIIRYRARK